MKVVIVLSVVLALCTVVRGGNDLKYELQLAKAALALKGTLTDAANELKQISNIALTVAKHNIKLNIRGMPAKIAAKILTPFISSLNFYATKAVVAP